MESIEKIEKNAGKTRSADRYREMQKRQEAQTGIKKRREDKKVQSKKMENHKEG